MLALSLCSIVCKAEPAWLPDFRNLLQNTNRELEEILPSLAPESSTPAVYAGLHRLDKSADTMVAELDSFLKKHPGVLKEQLRIGFHLRGELKQLGDNLRNIIIAGNFWDKKLGHPKEFVRITQSILKKGNRAETLLQKASKS